jgi:DNA-binding transcriptional MerR regulator
MDSAREKGPFKMRTIARLTEFSPEVLRAWERRHDLLHPLRGPGGHRLYTEEDLAVLRHVRSLISEGRSIGEIAGFGRQALLDAPQEAQTPVPSAAPAPVYVGADVETPSNEHARGAQAIVDAALKIDGAVINRVLDDAFASTSPEHVIAGLMLPAAQQIGDLWIAGRCSVASEHLASGIFVHRLRKMVETAEPANSEWRPVIVACFPDEYHQLGALISAYWLCRNGLRVSFLGAALPFDDLHSAWQVLEPAATLLSVTRRAVYDLHRLSFRKLLGELPSGMPLFVGGQGAPTEDPGAERLGARIFPVGQHSADVMTAVVNAIREHGRKASNRYRPA